MCSAASTWRSSTSRPRTSLKAAASSAKSHGEVAAQLVDLAGVALGGQDDGGGLGEVGPRALATRPSPALVTRVPVPRGLDGLP